MDYLVRSVPPCANTDLLAFTIDMCLPPFSIRPRTVFRAYSCPRLMCMVCGGFVAFVRLLVWWEDRAKVS
jgi:hypothetical protein